VQPRAIASIIARLSIIYGIYTETVGYKVVPDETVGRKHNPGGEVGLLEIPSATDQAVCGVLPSTRFIPEFLFFTLRSLKEEMKQRSGGGAQQNISQQIIRDLEPPLPPLEEQRRIVAELDAEAAQIETVRALIPRFEAKIQRVMDRVCGNGTDTSDTQVSASSDRIESVSPGLPKFRGCPVAVLPIPSTPAGLHNPPPTEALPA
jgi:restriction endonuclease S subunit